MESFAVRLSSRSCGAVAPLDAAVRGLALVARLAAAMLASVVAARRALRVDPITVLCAE